MFSVIFCYYYSRFLFTVHPTFTYCTLQSIVLMLSVHDTRDSILAIDVQFFGNYWGVVS